MPVSAADGSRTVYRVDCSCGWSHQAGTRTTVRRHGRAHAERAGHTPRPVSGVKPDGTEVATRGRGPRRTESGESGRVLSADEVYALGLYRTVR